jgi:FtsP/CotA-like multicopper oxidase with cupredoxin domain
VPNENLVWKDTVLIRTGETVDLLVEMSNPGWWMAHCHIAEHLESGMMLSFEVQSSSLRERRNTSSLARH